jgi:hypothetical protein
MSTVLGWSSTLGATINGNKVQLVPAGTSDITVNTSGYAAYSNNGHILILSTSVTNTNSNWLDALVIVDKVEYTIGGTKYIALTRVLSKAEYSVLTTAQLALGSGSWYWCNSIRNFSSDPNVLYVQSDGSYNYVNIGYSGSRPGVRLGTIIY